MKSTFIYISLLASLAAGQQILEFGTGELPSCAENCATLTTAQNGCIPPAAPVTDQAIYQSCFCQSAFLTTLYTSATTICDTTCTSQTDRNQIQSWFLALCQTGSTTSSTTSSTTTTGISPATTTGTTITSSSSSTATGTSSSSSSATDGSYNSTWWHVHGRWVAMAIVLLVGFFLLFVLGMCLKRRHRRRQQRSSMAAPVVWGPHQNQHHTGGINYPGTAPPSAMEKGKANIGAGHLPTPNAGPVDYSEKDGKSKSGSNNRLKKLIGR